MKKLINSIAFWIGLAVGIILSIAVCVIDYKIKFDGLCMDCDNDFGFPFRLYQSGSLIHSTQIIWIGLVGNLIFYCFFSILIGVLANYLWKNTIKSKSLK